MSRIDIGHTDHNKTVTIDLDILLKTRLLIQANSGGGKSYALRRILEQAFGKVQCIVIDPAGEFATLREKFGYVLVGKGGETPADIRSAGLVAEKLLELRASAVCDLYGLKPHERPIWVKNFLSATMNVPKKLWHPVLFVVDEAHKFCPEKGEGESEAKPEMLELVSDGRKYGFCAIFATQRLAKLDKSAAAELLNVLVGPTFLDIDLERAHRALGIIRADWKAFDAQMKTVAPGNFWALGRAISTERILVRIGGIETTHPEAGSGKHAAEPPPAPEKVKALLPKLADLPKAAEEKAHTVADLNRQIITLKRELRAAPQTVASKEVKVIDQGAIDRALEQASRKYRRALEEAMKFVARINIPDILKNVGAIEEDEIRKVVQTSIASATTSIRKRLEKAVSDTSGLQRQAMSLQELLKDLDLVEVKVEGAPKPRPDPPVRSFPQSNGSGDTALAPGARKILIAVAQYGTATAETIAVLTGYKQTSRSEYLRQLTVKGYVIGANGQWTVTEAGMEALGSSFDPLPIGGELREYWLNRLSGGEQKLFSALVESYPNAMDKETLQNATEYKATSVGEYVRLLKARRIVEPSGKGVKVVDALYD